MKSISLPIISVLVLFALLPTDTVSAQSRYEQSIKFWESGPLRWSDFQVRNLPEGSEAITDLSAGISYDFNTEKIGNLRFSLPNFRTQMYRLDSWYDPSKCNNWTLKYNQTIFDILEVMKREMQNAYNNNPYEEGLNVYFDQMISNTIDAFKMESSYGKDSLVIEKYSQVYKDKLDSINVQPVKEPQFTTTNGGYGLGIGLNYESFGRPISDGLNPSLSITMGIDVFYKRYIYNFYAGFGFNQPLKCDGFFHDDKYEYDWVKEKKTRNGYISLNAGYQIINNRTLAIAPFVGIGGSFIYQDSDTPDSNGKTYKSSDINGFRVQAGVTLDWKFKRKLLNSYTIDYFESKIRLLLFASRTNYKKIGETYSLNIGLSYYFDNWMLK